MAPVEVIWLFLVKTTFALHFVAPHPLPTLPSYRSASGIGYASNNYLKWQANQLAIQCTADTVNYIPSIAIDLWRNMCRQL